MRWYEYKMEVDDLHASDDLKAKLLAMQPAEEAPKSAKKPKKAIQLSPQGSEHRRLRPALRRWSVCSSPLPYQPAACGRRGPQLCP